MRDDQVLNVQSAMEKDTAPKVVAKESVILKVSRILCSREMTKLLIRLLVSSQYVLDTRLDETWNDFVMSLVADEFFPPNPYPRFVTRLRHCAAK